MEHPMNGALWQLQQRVMKNSYLGTTYPLLPGIRTSFFISFPSFVRHVQTILYPNNGIQMVRHVTKDASIGIIFPIIAILY